MQATTAIVLVIASVTNCIRCVQCAVTDDVHATENPLPAENDVALAQPSRLRELLVNELGNIIVKSVSMINKTQLWINNNNKNSAQLICD